MLEVIAGAVPDRFFQFPSPWHFLRSLQRRYSPGYRCSRIRVFHCCIHYQTARSRSAYFRVRVFFSSLPPALFLSHEPGQVNTPVALAFASAVFILFLVFRALLLLFARQRLPEGRRVPLPNPLHWIIIRENETSFLITRYSLFRGIFRICNI